LKAAVFGTQIVFAVFVVVLVGVHMWAKRFMNRTYIQAEPREEKDPLEHG
ncbi:MAG: hypothetical protein GWN41_02040, partial [Phycisphaerae bacterium]|nr:hypothetical protein [Phycisphaerae bacterium]